MTSRSSIFALIYGLPGAGKTTDMGASFPNSIFVCRKAKVVDDLLPHGLKSIVSNWQYTPRYHGVRTIMDVIDIVKELNALRMAGKLPPHLAIVDTICVDDLTEIADDTLRHLEDTRNLSGLKLWGALQRTFMDFRIAAQDAALNVVCNSWAAEPTTKEGKFCIGGPKFPSHSLTTLIPGVYDNVFRCVNDPLRLPWPNTYVATADTQWVSKDRDNIVTRLKAAPMNLGEIFRAANYTISRHPDLPWQEAEVVKMTDALLAGGAGTERSVLNPLYAELRATLIARYTELKVPNSTDVASAHARWTARDALDRTLIRRGLNAAQEVFF
jgi:hypothetical protein